MLEKSEFPRVKAANHAITSPPTHEYNCIGWAAGEDDRFWWPEPHPDSYWPPGIQRSESVKAFADAFATRGYERCDSSRLERNKEKVAIYAKGGRVTHMARQLPTGEWTSKIGKNIDITHSSAGVVGGGLYGDAVAFLSRPKQQ